ASRDGYRSDSPLANIALMSSPRNSLANFWDKQAPRIDHLCPGATRESGSTNSGIGTPGGWRDVTLPRPPVRLRPWSWPLPRQYRARFYVPHKIISVFAQNSGEDGGMRPCIVVEEMQLDSSAGEGALIVDASSSRRVDITACTKPPSDFDDPVLAAEL